MTNYEEEFIMIFAFEDNPFLCILSCPVSSVFNIIQKGVRNNKKLMIMSLLLKFSINPTKISNHAFNGVLHGIVGTM